MGIAAEVVFIRACRHVRVIPGVIAGVPAMDQLSARSFSGMNAVERKKHQVSLRRLYCLSGHRNLHFLRPRKRRGADDARQRQRGNQSDSIIFRAASVTFMRSN